MRSLLGLPRLSLWSLLLLTATPPRGANADFTKQFESSFSDTLAVRVPKPTDLYFTPDDEWLYVTTKDGRIWRINVDEMNSARGNDKDRVKPELLFTIPHPMCTNGARGLGGIAVHPDYPSTPWIYVFHNHDKYDDCSTEPDLDKGPVNRFSRWTLNSNLDGVLEDSELVMFETRRLNTQTHNSGDIAFGKDGYVYVTVGEGGTKKAKNDAGVVFPQALDVMLGVFVRLTDTGEIPPDNPYTPANGYPDAVVCGTDGESGDPDKPCQEIYATGLRNPFRFAMDPNTPEGVTRCFINEVGSNTWERILPCGDDHSGANYGYPYREGPCEAGTDTDCKLPDKKLGFTEAIHWYHHTESDGGAITGAAFVPDDAGWPADWTGAYLYAEFANDGIWRMNDDGKKGCTYDDGCDPPTSDYTDTETMFTDTKKVVGLQFGPHGGGGKALYYLMHLPGRDSDDEAVYRIAYTDADNRDPKPKISAVPTVGFTPLKVSFDASGSTDPDGDKLTYEWDFDDDGIVDSTARQPVFEYTKSGVYWAKLTVKDGNGGVDVTTIRIDVDNTPPRPKIISPAPGTTFAVGDEIILIGSAYDPEDGDLPGSSLTWEVRQHHRTHYHPYLDPTDGNNIKIDDAPEPEDFDASTNSYLAIHLTATDSAGLTSTTVVTMQPRTVNLVFDSEPSGMDLYINADKYTTPANIITWENHRFDVEAPVQTIKGGDGTSYGLKKWSDGVKDGVHQFVTPATDPEEPLVAKFGVAKPVPKIHNLLGGGMEDSSFTVDTDLKLVGSAMDGAGNDLPDSSLTWEIRYRRKDHRGHSSPFLEPTAGNNIQVRDKLVPEDLENAKEGYLEVLLTATDAGGESATTSVSLYPRTVDVEFKTKPEGLDVVLDGETYATPVTITTWENHKFNVRTSTQAMDGAVYKFASWSDGGKRSHKVQAAPSEKGRVVAKFDLALREPEIYGVEDGSTFAVGDAIQVKGRARDGEGNVLDSDSSLVWQVRVYDEDADRYRTIHKPTRGVGIKFDAPGPKSFDEAEAGYLEVLLSSTDATTGLTSTKSVILYPNMVDLAFETDPGRLYVIADGIELKTPASVTTWEGHRFVIEAPSQRRADVTYAWRSWSDGGAASHEYVVPAAKKRRNRAHTILATYGDPEPNESATMGPALIGALAASAAAVLLLLVIIVVVWRRNKKGIVIIDMNGMNGDEDSKKVSLGLFREGADESTLDSGSNEDMKLSKCSINFPSQIESSLASVGEASTHSNIVFPTPVNLVSYLVSTTSSSLREVGDDASQSGTRSITRESTEEASEPPISKDSIAEAGVLTEVPLAGADRELDATCSVDDDEIHHV